ncbi:AAA family ATPase [Psychromicrobium lacuslunae]|uniref:Chromosome partitioning protein n=1 Tax=Psychromicrobium lacuslunae TaxID=1618207 RepID=A0A0D4BYL7_9MICC|nr:hypothetical protein [Psychromicrobium lacuslunae]AJT41433.1 hypothetical protein UM93_07710 [Psychromicrobium lacuslunae]
MNFRFAVLGEAADRLVEQLEAIGEQFTVVRRCAELRELVAACQSGLAGVALLSEHTAELNSALLERLAACHSRVVVLTDDEAETQRLNSLGARVFSLGSDALKIIQGLESDSVDADGAVTEPAAQFLAIQDAKDDAASNKLLGEAEKKKHPKNVDSSQIIAIWGPIGSPGRTMLATNMAAEFAALGLEVLLIDADSYGASVAATLGILDESAGIARAVRLADQGSLDPEGLWQIAPELVFRGGRFRVLSGLTRPDRWPELRAMALQQLFTLSRQLLPVTIIDCGFSLETDEELSFDSYVPRRNAATLAALRSADQIIAVGAADSIGVPRLIRGLTELANICPGQEPLVVLNKVRRGAAGRSPEQALQQAWLRFGPQFSIKAFLPAETALLDRMLLSGELLIEAGPDSALRKKLQTFVSALAQRNSQTAVSSTTAKNG